MDYVATIIWIVSFVIVTVAVTGLSRRVGWSAPVSLVAVGAIASFMPGIPVVHVEPDLILYGLLPPLLFAAAIRTSFIDVRSRGDSILILSVAPVIATVVGLGFLTAWIVPSITLAAGFAFAAVVAPTDAVAVTSIAGRSKISRRVQTILEGESLLNDATALVALGASITAIVGIINPWQVGADFVLAVVVGAGIGFGVGWVLARIRAQVKAPVLDTSLSLVTPFIAFIPAQLLHGSGVLAVVIAGIYLAYRSPSVQSAESRIAESVNWRTVRFLLENSVFLFIGLNLAGILRGVAKSGIGVWQAIGISLLVLVGLIIARLLSVLSTTLIFRFGPRRLRERGWTWKNTIAIGFAGIRGVVTLAAVFLLPASTPQLQFLQFLAFIVVVGTLLQALALPWFFRRLKLPAPNFEQEVMETRSLMAEARIAGVAWLDEQSTDALEERVLTQLRSVSALFDSPDELPAAESAPVTYSRVRREMILAERAAVLAARSEGRYQEQSILAVLAAIDAEEVALRVASPKKSHD